MTLDELCAPFPPRFARGHSISMDDARKLAAIVEIEADEKFRLEIGVAIQMTVERLISGESDRFRDLEQRLDFRDLDKSLDDARYSENHAAAVALDGTLRWALGEDWRNKSHERLARELVRNGCRKPGRREPEEIKSFYEALADTVREFDPKSMKLPSKDFPRPTPLMRFARGCSDVAINIGERVIAARNEMTQEERLAAQERLQKLAISDGALCEVLRAAGK